MPTYFSGAQKCEFTLRMILIVINTGGKDVQNYDWFFTENSS